MRWIDRRDASPPEGKQVLIFSPAYREDEPMRFRIIEGQFFKLMTEATHWAYLVAPVEDHD